MKTWDKYIHTTLFVLEMGNFTQSLMKFIPFPMRHSKYFSNFTATYAITFTNRGYNYRKHNHAGRFLAKTLRLCRPFRYKSISSKAIYTYREC